MTKIMEWDGIKISDFKNINVFLPIFPTKEFT